MARGHELTVLTEEWRVVDSEYHRHCGLINRDGLQCFWCLDVANSVANLEAVDADERAYIARFHFVGFNVSHAREGVQLFDFGLDHRAVFLGEHDVLTVAQSPPAMSSALCRRRHRIHPSWKRLRVQ